MEEGRIAHIQTDSKSIWLYCSMDVVQTVFTHTVSMPASIN